MKRSLGSLYLLFWLKCRLVWRAYRRNLSTLAGAIVAALLLLPCSLAVAGGALAGFLLLNPESAAHLLRGILLVAYAIWLLVPIFGYALTEDYDISKLFLYPLSPRLLLAGAIVGSLVDFGVLFLLPTLAAVVIGFTKSVAAFPVVVLAAGLFLFHTVAFSQAVNLAGAGFMRSRRTRDIMVVLIPLLWAAIYAAWHVLPRRLASLEWSHFFDSRAWDLINYLPPGLAARSIAGIARGDLAAGLGFLLALGAVAAATLYLAAWVLELVYSGEVTSAPARPRAARARAAAPAGAPGAAGLTRPGPVVRLPAVVEAVASKELKYLVRDPYFKSTLAISIYMLAVVGLAFLVPREGREAMSLRFRQALPWGGTGLLLLMQSQLPFNAFGTEGRAASLLFLFPSPRRQILVGKNLALFIAFSVVNPVFVLIFAALARDASLFPGLLLWMELGTVVLISWGNLVSVWFPIPVVMRGWSIRQQSASLGFTRALLYLFAASVDSILVLPVLAAFVIPLHWIGSAWLAVTVPAAIGYVGVCYLMSLRLAEPELLRREIDIVAALGQEP